MYMSIYDKCIDLIDEIDDDHIRDNLLSKLSKVAKGAKGSKGSTDSTTIVNVVNAATAPNAPVSITSRQKSRQVTVSGNPDEKHIRDKLTNFLTELHRIKNTYDNLSYTTIYSLGAVEQFLPKSRNGRSNTKIFLDWDDTMVRWGTNDLVEPEITKHMMDKLLTHGYDVSIITGRFSDICTNMAEHHIEHVKDNVRNTIFPTLSELDINLDVYDDHSWVDIVDDGKTVGFYYMGILFGADKGRIIRGYLKTIGADPDSVNIVFVDDLDGYHLTVQHTFPESVRLRRLYAPGF